MPKWRYTLPLHTFVMCLWLIISSVVLAQDSTPIALGQNAPGAVSAETPTALFTLTAMAGDTAMIEVLGFAEGFAPRFRVLNPSNVEILNVANADGATIVTGSASFAEAGTYTIEVSGENGTAGQFLVSVQAGAPLPAPVMLVVGQPVEDVVSGQGPLLYEFSGLATEPVILSIVSKLPDVGPSVTVRDHSANKTIATNDSGITALVYRVGAGTSVYQVEVRHSASSQVASIPFTICLEASTAWGACNFGLVAAASIEAVATESAAPVSATCSAAPSTGSAVNVRSGPGTGYGITGTLQVGQSYPVTGQLAGGGWYTVNINGQTGWVASSVVQLTGECAALSVVNAPAGAPPVPTLAPTSAPPAAPTSASAPTTASTTAPTATEEPDLLPDLMVLAFDEDAEPERLTRTVIAVVGNYGEGSAGPSVVSICGGDGECRTQSVPALGPGQTFEASAPFANNMIGVAHTISATVDRDNTVEESDEGNNTGQAEVRA